MNATQVLKRLQAQVPDQAYQWLESKVTSLEKDFKKSSFQMAFSAVPRFFDSQALVLSSEVLEEFSADYPGFYPQEWPRARWARLVLLLSLASDDPQDYQKNILELFDTADMGESEALYASLPVYAHPELFLDQAIEGLRTNIATIFDAIALQNPYPGNHFPEAAWNQMYLKAAFMGRPIYKILAIDKRSNPDLSRIISDFAHERWAAGREVAPDMWLACEYHSNPSLEKDIQALIQSGEETQLKVAYRLCQNHSGLKALLKEISSNMKGGAESISFSWEQISEDYYTQA